MVQHSFTSTETRKLVRTDSPGRPPRLSHSSWTMVWRWGNRKLIYLSLRCHNHNDTCIKMGSDESHFNVWLIVRDKVTRQVFTAHNFWRERRAEADSNWGSSAYQPNALLLGETGSRGWGGGCCVYLSGGQCKTHNSQRAPTINTVTDIMKKTDALATLRKFCHRFRKSIIC